MKTNKSKILVLSPDMAPTPGGLEKYTECLILSLRKLGYNVVGVLWDSKSNNYNLEKIIKLKHKQIPVDSLGGKTRYKYFEILALYKIIKSYNINTIICTWWDPFGYYISFLKCFYNIKYIQIAHGQEVARFLDDQSIYGRLKFFQEKLSFLFSNKIIPVSPYTSKLVNKVLKNNKLKVIPNGLTKKDINKFQRLDNNISDFLNIPVDSRIILHVGRLVERKGHIKFLKIFKKLKEKRNIDCDYVIIGDGPLNLKIEGFINKDTELSRNVHIIKYLSHENLIRLYNRAHISLSITDCVKKGWDTEGFGITVLEGYASRSLVLGSKIGGLMNVIVDEKTGFFADLQDEDDFLMILKKTLELEKNKMTKNGFSHLQKYFIWENIVKEYKTVLEDLRLK